MQLPVIGKEARVEIRSGEYVVRGSSTMLLSGTILPSEKYDPPNSFRLTGPKEMPVRVVSMSLVLKIDDVPRLAQAPKTRTFKVSGSKPGTSYQVIMDETGRLQCNCTGFGFKKACRHTADVANHLTKENK